jgi:predicted TIM-barrel fold metal-dependent hydrolase
VISADDHIDVQWMPKTAWTERMPNKWRDRAPHVVETDKGPVWMCDGNSWGPWGKKGKTLVGGRRWAIERFREFSDDEVPPTDPAMRLADMDQDGIDASIMYGPVGPLAVPDAELRRLCFQTYNDWLAEFCAASPERLLGVGLLPADAPLEARDELLRLAAKGIRHVNMAAARANPPVWAEAWEPFWAAAEETGVPVGFHLPGARRERAQSNDIKPIVPAALGFVDSSLSLMDPLIGLVFSGALERHPGLRIVLAEAGLGWVPYVVDRMEHAFDQYQDAADYWRERQGGVGLSLRPKEYCRRQVWLTFQEDVPGLQLLDLLGEDNVMWASDYPHPDSTWPHSQAVIDRQLSGWDTRLRHKIVCGNAQALYGLAAA